MQLDQAMGSMIGAKGLRRCCELLSGSTDAAETAAQQFEVD
jgi:hypothetical protein